VGILGQGSLVDHSAADVVVVVGQDKGFEADVPTFQLVPA
jgi:hypothetical protein